MSLEQSNILERTLNLRVGQAPIAYILHVFCLVKFKSSVLCGCRTNRIPIVSFKFVLKY